MVYVFVTPMEPGQSHVTTECVQNVDANVNLGSSYAGMTGPRNVGPSRLGVINVVTRETISSRLMVTRYTRDGMLMSYHQYCGGP